MSNPLQGFQNAQPPQTQATGEKRIVDGQSLLNAKAAGKLNENRFTSLKPRHNDK
jgi:hypothetical protein